MVRRPYDDYDAEAEQAEDGPEQTTAEHDRAARERWPLVDFVAQQLETHRHPTPRPIPPTAMSFPPAAPAEPPSPVPPAPLAEPPSPAPPPAETRDTPETPGPGEPSRPARRRRKRRFRRPWWA